MKQNPSFPALVRVGVTALALLSACTVSQAADKPGATKATKVEASAEAPLVKVSDAWIRATVKGQSGTGGFMNLMASQALTLTGFNTSVAADSELHEMLMDGGVMRMHAVSSLPLPAGQTVSLRPGMGGHHLMLMDLKQQLKEGDEVTVTLLLRTADGKTIKQDVKVPVKSGSMTMAPSMGASGAGPHHKMMHGGMHQ
ncbi:MAG TPA: copper chaperone PCu(A)C [Aquabacterium sp.]|uniref:copper chaperone PCu(A)C n=1 Tax=Aquabacterium sp. TaxID=1872578 RepID=UPI002E325D45|nr:copper chaperone PCu(A)C [Aquabacterium sp.]HEX5356700.1 copper chaperone PCu(A)C [Aquabacterium sp.]